MSTSTILKLQAVGFSREQVEALVDILGTQPASRADVADTRNEMKAAVADLAHDLKNSLGERKAEDARTRSDLERLEGAVSRLSGGLTWRLGLLMLVVAAAAVAAVRYLPPFHP